MSTSSRESLKSSGEKRRTTEPNSLRTSEEEDRNKGNFSITQMNPFLDPMMEKGSGAIIRISLYKRGRKIISSVF